MPENPDSRLTGGQAADVQAARGILAEPPPGPGEVLMRLGRMRIHLEQMIALVEQLAGDGGGVA